MFDHVRTVAVYVEDKERAKSFYTEVLGFTVTADLGPDLCFLRTRSGKLHLYLSGGCRPGPPRADATRLGFFLETTESAHETHRRLVAAGVNVLDETPEEVGEDTFTFRFLDPDGNILEAVGKGES